MSTISLDLTKSIKSETWLYKKLKYRNLIIQKKNTRTELTKMKKYKD